MISGPQHATSHCMVSLTRTIFYLHLSIVTLVYTYSYNEMWKWRVDDHLFIYENFPRWKWLHTRLNMRGARMQNLHMYFHFSHYLHEWKTYYRREIITKKDDCNWSLSWAHHRWIILFSVPKYVCHFNYHGFCHPLWNLDWLMNMSIFSSTELGPTHPGFK